MKFIILLFSLFGFFIHAAEDLLSLSLATGKTNPNSESIQSAALSYSRLYEIDQSFLKAKWKLGGGLRVYAVSADRFQTHGDYNEVIEDLSSQSINAFIETQLAWKKWFIGSNLDLIGVTTGSDSRVSGTNRSLSLESFNLFLFAKNDRGSLNSEFYVGHKFDSFSLRAGISHIVTEFEGDVPGTNERRLAFSNLLFLSLTYSI